MKIGLNATCINDRPSGAKQRFIGINRELVKRLPDAEFVIYEPDDCRVASWFNGASNVSARHTPLPSEGRARRFIGGLQYWRSALSREGFDIFEGFNLPLVKATTGQTLLTIHDIRGLRPESRAWERAVFKSVLSRSLKAADHVITVSESMRKEILSFYPDVPISVIYNGLDANEFDRVSAADLQEFRRKFALPEEFVLAVGHFESRKNYLRLIDAIALLRDRGRSCSLLIVGNDSGERKAVEERVASVNLAGSVKILSGISDLEVRCAYKLCSLFVFPSSYEGFGIPILEAMAAGRPIVLSDIPVFREITQNSGVYFPHHDVELMALAIEKILTSSSERARLVEYGNNRIQSFSYQSLAAQVENLYRAVL
ncbi:MAG: glycosyltransferase family 1 protein [Gallionella sp.]|nr:glycosyltransferase family 1 protein [Gallionella sp.]